MVHIEFIAVGFLIGIAAAAPVGPVNVMTLQRTLRYGFVAGLLAGMGAALADVLFASIAAYGLSAVDGFIEGNSQKIQLAGGVLVIGFGIRSLLSHPKLSNGSAMVNNRRSLSGFATAFAMTITNPGTVLGFLALFGALGEWAPEPAEWVATGYLVIGVAIGATVWWASLAWVVSHLRGTMTSHALERINQVAGSLLIAFGVFILARLALLKLGVL